MHFLWRSLIYLNFVNRIMDPWLVCSNQKLSKNTREYIGKHLNGRRRGLRARVLSNSFIVSNLHDMDSKKKSEETTYCSFLTVV